MLIRNFYIFSFSLIMTAQVFSLEKQNNITQYIHDSWSEKEGMPQRTITSIAQTPDGSLWFGTEEGLVQFNGSHFAHFNRSSSIISGSIDAVITHHVAKAAGIRAVCEPKCFRASRAPSPAFCMPTSIARVRFRFLSKR